MRTNGTLTRKTDPYQKWPSSQPLASGPSAPAPPATPAQIAMAFVRSSGGNTLTRIESVDGMMNAAHAPIRARRGDDLPHLGRRGGEQRGEEEADEPELQRALAAEPVADRAGGEQQAGEHQRVRRRRPTAAGTSSRRGPRTASGSRRSGWSCRRRRSGGSGRARPRSTNGARESPRHSCRPLCRVPSRDTT